MKKPFDLFKSRTSYTIVMQFESKFLLADFIKGLAEVKANETSLLFLIDEFEKIIDQHEELGFTRVLLSEAMLELLEDNVSFLNDKKYILGKKCITYV